MQDLHRAYFNFDFMFKSFFLDEDQIKLTEQFMSKYDQDIGGETDAREIVEAKHNFKDDDSVKKEQIIAAEEATSKPSDSDEVPFQSKTGPALKFMNIELKIEPSKAKETKKSDDKKKQLESMKIKLTPIPCPHCGKLLTNRYTCAQHVKNIHEDLSQHFCDICGKECRGKINLKVHIKRCHRASIKLPCTECGKMVKSMRYHMLSRHISNSEKRYVCTEDLCGKGFSFKDKYEEHVRIHRKIKPYKCRIDPGSCSFAAVSAGNRNKHEKNHQSQRKKMTKKIKS